MGYDRNDRYGRDYRGHDRGYGRDDDRGFFDRAGDEVRSWFGDEEAERRRRMDEAADERYERERHARGDGGGYRGSDRYPAWARSNRDEGYASRDRPAASTYAGVRYDRGGEGRSFDDGRGYGGGFGAGRDGDYRSQHRDRAQGDRGHWGAGWDDSGGYGAGAARGGVDDDQHGYRSWRERQVSALDRDYDEYRRENRQRFESEFAAWRANRQTQRDSLTQVKEHQEVVGSDGAHVGTVDHVRSDHILLTKTDRDAGGHHHAIPSSWVASVADKVTLNKTAEDAKRAWRDTEERGGLFGGDDRERTEVSGTGRHNLDRSFSGTY